MYQLGSKGAGAPGSGDPKQTRCGSSLPTESKGRKTKGGEKERNLFQGGQHCEDKTVDWCLKDHLQDVAVSSVGSRSGSVCAGQ